MAPNFLVLLQSKTKVETGDLMLRKNYPNTKTAYRIGENMNKDFIDNFIDFVDITLHSMIPKIRTLIYKNIQNIYTQDMYETRTKYIQDTYRIHT